MLGKQLFTFEANCIILDNLGSLAETKYLTYFKESSVNADMKDVKMAESESEEGQYWSDATESN